MSDSHLRLGGNDEEDLILPDGSSVPYEDVEEIGRGGMGAILRSYDPRLGRDVAKKVLLLGRDPDQVQRFLREARITGRLEHPNIPPVHDLGTDPQGRHFFTMKVVEGKSLEEILEAVDKGDQTLMARYPLPRLLQVFLKVCDAVSFAHSKNVLHRDLKPANIMVGEFGEVLVMDWGLAKLVDIPDLPDQPSSIDDASSERSAEPDLPDRALQIDPSPEASEAGGQPSDVIHLSKPDAEADTSPTVILPTDSEIQGPLLQEGFYQVDQSPPEADQVDQAPQVDQGLEDSKLTRQGQIVGTPAYMSPEQADGKADQITIRSDVYALGAMLYEMLTLSPPVEGKTLLETLAKVSSGDIERPSAMAPDRAIPRELEAITLKALSKDPARRYPDVRDMSRDVELYLDGRTVSAVADNPLVKLRKWVRRNRGLSAGLGAALLALVVLGWFLFLAPGELTLRCDADGAEVYVDGELLDQRTPVDPVRLWPGLHEISLKAARRETVTQTVRIRPGRSSVLELKPALLFGSVDVITAPPGATLSVDGEVRGLTPLSGLSERKGPRKIRLTLENYHPLETVLDVEPGLAARLERSLTHETGTVDLVSPVSEVSVTLTPAGGGNPVRLMTNVLGRKVDTGAYTVTFSKINHFPASAHLVVRPGRHHTVQLTPATQKLWEHSTPSTIRQADVADLDRDGRLDIVISSKDTQTGGLLSCRSLSTFGEKWSYRQSDSFSKDARSNHFQFRLVDLDRDGFLDLLGLGPRNLFVLNGETGHRTLHFPLFSASHCEVDDLNGDGRLDLVVGTPYSGVLAIDRESGGVLWHFYVRNMDYVRSHPLVVARDKEKDVIFSCRGGALRCLSGRTGRPRWVDPNAGVWSSLITLADYDGDGKKDLAFFTREGELRLVDPMTGQRRLNLPLQKNITGLTLPYAREGRDAFLAVGRKGSFLCASIVDGEFQTHWTLDEPGAAFYVPVLFDLEGDGRPEAAAISVGNALVLVLDAVTGREITRFHTTGKPRAVHPVDVDDDGRLELIVPTSKAVAAYRCQERPRIVVLETGFPQHRIPCAGRFTAEGQGVVFSGENQIRLWSERGRKVLWASEPGRWGGASFVAADLNGDGIDEVLIGQGYENKIVALDGPTGRELWSRETQGAMYSYPRTADVNGDGRLEVIALSRMGELLCLAGTTGKERWSDALKSAFYSPCIADVNGDGRLEVAVDTPADNEFRIYDGATGEVLTTLELPTGRATTVTTAGDVDNDGRDDLFHGSFLGLFRRIDGAGRIVWERRFGTASADCIPLLGDVNGDGAVELVFSMLDGSVFCVRARTGERVWTTNIGVTSRMNALVLSRFGGVPALFGFDTDGLLILDGATGRILASMATFGSVRTAPQLTDLNGDGRMDLLANSQEGRIFFVDDFSALAKAYRRSLGIRQSWRQIRDPLEARTLHRLERQGDFTGLGRALRLTPPPGPGYAHLLPYYRGRAACAAGRWREALGHFDEGARLGSRMPELGLYRVEALLRLDREGEARAEIGRRIQGSIIALDQALLREEGRLDPRVGELITRSLEEDHDRPDPAPGLITLRAEFERRGEDQQAYEMLARAVRYGVRGTDLRAGLRRDFARAAERRSMTTLNLIDHQGAFRILDAALTYDPDNSRLLFLRAFFSQERALQPATVQRYLDKALKARPLYPSAVGFAGRLEETRGRISEARKLYAKALSLHPDDPYTNYFMAQYHVREGRRDAALEALRKSTAFYPFRGLAMKRIRELRKR